MDTNYKRELIDQLELLDEAASLADIQKVTSGFFNQKTSVSSAGKYAVGTSLGFAVLTVLLITEAFGLRSAMGFKYIIYSAWVVIPPVWFLYEYAYVFADEYKFDADLLADLKYKQELAGKIWAGLMVLITALIYFRYGLKIT
jgi:hypothetical protein